jgi:hypothetical protein
MTAESYVPFATEVGGTNWPYWLLTALLVVVSTCLGLVARQRDRAQEERDLYRAALLRVDPHEALVVAEVLHPGTGR